MGILGFLVSGLSAGLTVSALGINLLTVGLGAALTAVAGLFASLPSL